MRVLMLTIGICKFKTIRNLGPKEISNYLYSGSDLLLLVG